MVTQADNKEIGFINPIVLSKLNSTVAGQLAYLFNRKRGLLYNSPQWPVAPDLQKYVIYFWLTLYLILLPCCVITHMGVF